MSTQLPENLVRHAGVDRAFHWLTALAMTVLLVTSFLPIMGIRFVWLELHWSSGVLLTVLVLLHIARALRGRNGRLMKLRRADFDELKGTQRPGKYSLQQKLIHLAWSAAILVAIITGVVMMVKAGTPFFSRNPYILSYRSWGLVTLLHDLAALASVFLILVHVYFGLLPEKRQYLRSMVGGTVRREELAADHDLDKVARGE